MNLAYGLVSGFSAAHPFLRVREAYLYSALHKCVNLRVLFVCVYRDHHHGLKFGNLSRLDTSMPPALSVDLKRRIVQLRRKGLTMRDIAMQMNVSVGGVHKTPCTNEECGEYIDPSKKQTGRPPILDDDDAWYLKSLLESNPTLYLDEIKEKLEAVRNISVSMSTISRFLRSRDFTWKAVSRKALEGDEMVRACWEVETAQ